MTPGATVEEAIDALRNFDGDTDAFTEIYLVDEEKRIGGVVPLVQMLLATKEASLASLPQGHVVTCNLDANANKVAELFDKYNLRSLPVVDEKKVLLGVIHADQVITVLRAKH